MVAQELQISFNLILLFAHMLIIQINPLSERPSAASLNEPCAISPFLIIIEGRL